MFTAVTVMVGDDIEQQIRRLPCWQDRVEIGVLDGGMTNHNFLVDHRDARYVVRLGQDMPVHAIERWHELAVAQAAHAAGLSPEVVFAAPGVMVSRFIAGRTLASHDVRDARVRDALVRLLRGCHRDVPRHLRGPVLMFWVFQVIRNYLAELQRHTSCLMREHLCGWAAMAVELEQAVGPVNIVLGHNDLLAANLIDDGTRLWLIDWEYAGFNSPLFDLANLSINNGFDTAACRDLLTRYFECEPDAARWRAFVAMQCASVLRETLWGLVSHHTSTVDVDHAAYARQWQQKLDPAWQAFRGCEVPG